MARRPNYPPLKVLINGRQVGILRRQATGAIEFRYSEQWLDRTGHFPISLSLPLSEERYVGERVFNVFDNLLPDNNAVRRRIAERVGARGDDCFSLLSLLGRDCVGALQFLPDDIDPGEVGASDGEPISTDDIGAMITNLTTAPLGLEQGTDFRISIAGAQEKTALLRKGDCWLRPTGTSATTHILKPAIGHLPNGIDLTNSVENEFLCLKILEALGVPVAKAEMIEFGAHRTLVVERLDRRWAKDGRLLRLPQEDFCQALSIPPNLKYQSDGGPDMVRMLRLLDGSDQVEQDRETVLRACFIFWLIGATDGHAKNFSLFLRPGGGYRLTPLYDVLSAQPSFDRGQIPRRDFKLAQSIGTSRHYRLDAIAPRHFLQTAKQAGIAPQIMRRIIEELAESADTRLQALFAQLPDQIPPALPETLGHAIRQRLALPIT